MLVPYLFLLFKNFNFSFFLKFELTYFQKFFSDFIFIFIWRLDLFKQLLNLLILFSIVLKHLIDVVITLFQLITQIIFLFLNLLHLVWIFSKSVLSQMLQLLMKIRVMLSKTINFCLQVFILSLQTCDEKFEFTHIWRIVLF